MLSLLVLDLKAVDLSYIEMLISDIENADGKEQSQLCDWMIANVIMAAQIGIADESLREWCIALGERLGLYKDYAVSKGCTSPYLPIWIGSVAGKKRGG
ncbi:MAG TPA: hypothetical protein VKK31_27265 [Thermoanaerobaculia bacterium]|nr:hypothetical protein [Thermoanaerobaculia bacterium]